MRKTRSQLLITGALVIGLMAPVGAQSIPVAIPDISTGLAPITFTNWGGMGVWQQVTNGWTQLTNEAKNLLSFGNIQQLNPTSTIQSLLTPATATSPNVATNAAQAVISQSQVTEQQLQQYQAQANASQGAHMDAEITNANLSAIATGQESDRVQHSLEVQQHQDDTATEAKGLGILFGGGD